MSKLKNTLYSRVIIAGGGTGGHIFPALAIAKQLQQYNPYLELLFIGSKHRMEMQRVPAAGYQIQGLDIQGFNRRQWWRNLGLIYKLLRSLVAVYKILQNFQPQVVVGVGGYSSFPVLLVAQLMRIPTLIQEQNSYAGLTNRLLGKYAAAICLGYQDAARFFVPTRSLYTGNPVRQDLLQLARQSKDTRAKAGLYTRFGLVANKPIVLIVGGSLGSGVLNNFVMRHWEDFQDVQLIWQCGTAMYKKIASRLRDCPHIYATDFLEDIASAYQLADVVISRAGALAVAEIAALSKPAIFVPWSKATGNHQYHNAYSLVQAGAALMVTETELQNTLYSQLRTLLAKPELRTQLQANLKQFQSLNATELIARKILHLCEQLAPPLTKVYMLGIGGAGMQALARYLAQQGVEVAGYDQAQSRYSMALAEMGISIDYQENPAQIPKDVDWIIYTPALFSTSPLMRACKERKLPLLKRGFVLGHLTRNATNICIAGTHGKTTTCALFAHIAKTANYNVQEFIGGSLISNQPLMSSQSLPSAQSAVKGYHLNVIEADEYDRSFLSLSPYLAVITAMDSDHLEIYGSQEQMWQAYYAFASQIPPKGVLIVPYTLAKQHDFGSTNLLSYSISDARATIFANQLSYHADNSVHFDVIIKGILYARMRLPQGTDFNVENALAAIMLAYILEIPKSIVKEALSLYAGVRRRFELLYDDGKCCYIQDYAHHPRELEGCIRAVHKRYAARRVLVIFQPHLFSRTQYFYAEFAQVLDQAEAEIVLLPIDPARERPVAGVDSALIAQAMRRPAVVLQVEECLQWIKKQQPWEVILSVGAGGSLEVLAEGVIGYLKSNKGASEINQPDSQDARSL